MENWKPTVDVPVTFEKADATGTSEIRFTLFSDGSVYLTGAEEVMFEENSLGSALRWLKEHG
jgi:hypothetical protein